MRTLNALMQTSMRILSFNVPQVKQQMFLYKFAECMSSLQMKQTFAEF
jgi:hypothetical protein